jgi:hypothetical protein
MTTNNLNIKDNKATEDQFKTCLEAVRSHDPNISQIFLLNSKFLENDSMTSRLYYMSIDFGNVSAVKTLINMGAKLDIIMNSYTIIHRVVLTGLHHIYPNIFRILVETGANLDIQDSDGDTALHMLANRADDDEFIYLLAAGADSTILNNSGLSAISLAKGCRSCIYSLNLDPNNEIIYRDVQKRALKEIREKAREICIALYELDLDALRMCYIITEACVPYARQLDFHRVWNLVVCVRHFHDRRKRKVEALLTQ